LLNWEGANPSNRRGSKHFKGWKKTKKPQHVFRIRTNKKAVCSPPPGSPGRKKGNHQLQQKLLKKERKNVEEGIVDEEDPPRQRGRENLIKKRGMV